MSEDLKVLREQLECPGIMLASEQIPEEVMTYIRRLESNTIELADTRNSYANVAYQAQTAAIDLTRQLADAQAVIRRQADEIAAYRTALETAKKELLSAWEPPLWAKYALRAIRKALAAYPCPTGVGKTGDQEDGG